MSIELHQPPVEVQVRSTTAAFEPNDIREGFELAKLLARSGLVPRALATPEAVFYVIAAGRELGLTAVQSIRSLHIIDGKIVMAADMIVAQVHRSGLCLHFSLIESTEKIATFETHRRGAPSPVRMSYTIEQANRAGLTGKTNWKAHPEAMLRARCQSALARAVYPDAAQGLYDTEEGEEMRRANANAHPPHSPAPPVAPAAAPPASSGVEAVVAAWTLKIGHAAAAKKKITALLELAPGIADGCTNGARERVIDAWESALATAATALVTDVPKLERLRAGVLEIGADDLKDVALKVCDQRAEALGLVDPERVAIETEGEA